jgi:hypothetical protein
LEVHLELLLLVEFAVEPFDLLIFFGELALERF